MVNINKKTLKKVMKGNEQHYEKLYLSYIAALVKSENLQNRLEETCKTLMSTPSKLLIKKSETLNNNLNDLLVKVMLMQKTIDLINAAEM